MSERILPDAEARRRIAQDLDATLFVEAAAGTGKTTALVGRMVALLREGRAELERMVAVTFTEKAAGELKLRLRSEIESARSAAPDATVRARLDTALGQLELARINTIHAFCADLLRERPLEAGVDPLFQVAPDDAAAVILDEAFSDWFDPALANPPEGVRRMLRRRPVRWDDPSPREQLLAAARNLVEHRDFDGAWTRKPFERDHRLGGLLDDLHELGALAKRAQKSDDWLAKNLANIERFLRENRYRDRATRDYDALEAALREFARNNRMGWGWKGYGRDYGPGLLRADVLRDRDAVKDELERFFADADADLAALLREELRPVVAGYQERKQEAGCLDFLDLLMRARDLIRDHRGIRTAMQRRYTHFVVDEFQDTDPLQAERLLLLAADDPAVDDADAAVPVPGKLFVVGDPKQSIYRFRRADVVLYERIKSRLGARGVDLLQLNTSFRSVPGIQSAVNAAFAPVMTGETEGQPGYVPLEAWRAPRASQPSVVSLPVPRPWTLYNDGGGRINNYQIDASFPDAVGAWVHWLLTESGWKVTERTASGEDTWVPVAARHVCLLLRRFRSWQTDVTRADGDAALCRLLAPVDGPDDGRSVFAALKGPFFALHDAALLAFRAESTTWHALQPVEGREWSGEARPVAEALAVLAELHYNRNRRPIAHTVSRFLEVVRAHAGIALQPRGEQALANCQRAVDLARRFERGGATSFRAFVRFLEQESERGGTEEAPIVEEGTDGVRIMTVHKAKGLEFPVVVLADPTCKLLRAHPTRHVDTARAVWAESLAGCAPHDLLDAHEQEQRLDLDEAHRLAYVAATRARDVLVVPGLGEEPMAGWLEMLNPALLPPPDTRRDAQPAPGCPRFGSRTVVDSPNAAELERDIAPGSHRPLLGEHDVVWWDPNTLELDVEPQTDPLQIDVLDSAKDPAGAVAGAAQHAAWRDARATTLERGATPSLKVRAVTEAAEAGAIAELVPVEVVHAGTARPGRPAGVRFGSLVHGVLADMSLVDAPGNLEELAARHARELDAPPVEVQAAAEAARGAWEHTLLRRAAAAHTVRRETPVWWTASDGTLLEGVVDLAFREETSEGPRWTVVDFKTDREVEDRLTAYTLQVGVYVKGISQAVGEPAKGVLFVV